MRKLAPINRNSKPGFYESASPGAPRFLVLPGARHGLGAIQLDATANRRAFTFVELTSRPIGKGYWTAGVSFKTDLDHSGLEPTESPIGAVVVSPNDASFQVFDENGVVKLLVLRTFGDTPTPGECSPGIALRWEIPDEHTGEGAPALFQSHPRLAKAEAPKAADSPAGQV